MAGGTPDQSEAVARRFPALPLVFVIGVPVIVGAVSPSALITVLIDGLSAATVLLPAVLGGLALVPVLRLGPLPLRWHLLIGSVLGVGGLSLLVLLLGLAGVFQRPVWIVILAAATVAGVIRLRSLLPHETEVPHRSTGASRVFGTPTFQTIWLLALPFLALALLSASNPPGFVWAEEAYGYDVLEYHLQLPKEYLEIGSIAYLPHNVYANFPANVEMLYLLAMIVIDDVPDSGTVANMIHLYLAMLTVLAAWVAGREWSPTAGVVCGVVVATAGWLPYLCGLAYVENGMLFFGMASAAGLVRLLRTRESEPIQGMTTLRWAAVSGIAAGLACGCKYTAVPMIAIPLGVSMLFVNVGTVRRKIAHTSVFFVAALAFASPWLIKNLVMTGNPVFPLVNSSFQATPPGWTAEETTRWDAGHRLPIEQASLGARARLMWDHVLNDKYARFGPAVFALGALALFRRRWQRVDLAVGILALIQLGVWFFATHLFARFAVVLLIPLTLMAGRAVLASPVNVRAWIAAVILSVGSVWNLFGTVALHREESVAGAPASAIYDGQLPGTEYYQVVNQELPAESRVLLVGDAKAFYFRDGVDYCVTFNRNPFLERLIDAESEREIVQWLQQRGYTHILVDWSEVRRLAATYGFSPSMEAKQLEAWFDRLAKNDIRLLREFHRAGSTARHVELFSVPHSVAEN